MDGQEEPSYRNMADLAQRIIDIGESLEKIEDRLLKLETQCLPLYTVDLDLLLRQFLQLKVMYSVNIIVADLRDRNSRIVLPLAPPPPGFPDVAGYHEKQKAKQGYEEAMRYIRDSFLTLVGEMKNTDNPYLLAHNWYVNAKAYLEKSNHVGILENSVDVVFPMPNKEEL